MTDQESTRADDVAGRKLACRCREVSEADVLEAIRDGARSLRGVKIRTRAGTGLCQGQTCGPIVESILKRELGPRVQPDDRPKRPPVRALPVDVLADTRPPVEGQECAQTDSPTSSS